MSAEYFHHTDRMAWIPLSDGISFKPITFFPDDTDAVTARAEYVRWCDDHGVAPHPALTATVTA